MLYFRIKAKCVGKPSKDQVYSNLNRLLTDFVLGESQIYRLQKGEDVKVSWVKEEWVLAIIGDDEE